MGLPHVDVFTFADSGVGFIARCGHRAWWAVWGGQLTIDNGVTLAGELGISSVIIGLFVVAVGTSLPELVTSIIAAFRGESDLALGNVVGSNIFNALFVRR